MFFFGKVVGPLSWCPRKCLESATRKAAEQKLKRPPFFWRRRSLSFECSITGEAFKKVQAK